MRELRAAYERFQEDQDVGALVESVRRQEAPAESGGGPGTRGLTRDDLHLVCFDYVWS